MPEVVRRSSISLSSGVKYNAPISGDIAPPATIPLPVLQCPGWDKYSDTMLMTGGVTLYCLRRSRMIWSSQELLEANVDTIRALATSASGMTPTSGMTGPLAVELD